MFGTIASLIIAVVLYVNPVIPEHAVNGSLIDAAMVATAIALIVIFAFMRVMAWAPLQKGEQNMTPRMLELYKCDRHFVYANFWIIFFALASVVLAANKYFQHPINFTAVLALWIVLLGISLDALNHVLKRTLDYFNPFTVIEMFTHQAKVSIQNDHEIDLCNWIDAISEVANKAISRTGSALCNQAIDETQLIARNFLESAKSIGHEANDKQTQQLGIHDKVGYTLFFLFQRYEAIHDKAIEKKLESISNNLITVLGKISVYGAKYDLSIASYPLHYLGKFATRAVNNNLSEVGIKASCTLLGIANAIVNEVNIAFSDLKDPFISITTHLQEIAQATFQKDKSTNIKILIQPFVDLKELLQNEKVATHQDTPAILENINRVIAEFETLEAVMRTIPPLPVIEEKA